MGGVCHAAAAAASWHSFKRTVCRSGASPWALLQTICPCLDIYLCFIRMHHITNMCIHISQSRPVVGTFISLAAARLGVSTSAHPMCALRPRCSTLWTISPRLDFPPSHYSRGWAVPFTSAPSIPPPQEVVKKTWNIYLGTFCPETIPTGCNSNVRDQFCFLSPAHLVLKQCGLWANAVDFPLYDPNKSGLTVLQWLLYLFWYSGKISFLKMSKSSVLSLFASCPRYFSNRMNGKYTQSEYVWWHIRELQCANKCGVKMPLFMIRLNVALQSLNFLYNNNKTPQRCQKSFFLYLIRLLCASQNCYMAP